jgi:hypothetical protein
MRTADVATSSRSRRKILIFLTTVTLLAATGCSTTTSGRGSQAPNTKPSFPTGTTSEPTPRVSTPTASSPLPSSPSSTPTIPSLAARTAALSHASGGLPSAIVAVPGGYEAMTWDQATHVGFWSDSISSTTWQRVGSSTYPWVPAIGGPPQAEATGALLTGMQHATFIVTGNFSGDGSGNAVAYTTGANGWGVIKAEPNGNIGPSGQPVSADRIGLSFGFKFVGGLLETQDCNPSFPIADCGGPTTIVKLWKWTGTDFRRV